MKLKPFTGLRLYLFFLLFLLAVGFCSEYLLMPKGSFFLGLIGVTDFAQVDWSVYHVLFFNYDAAIIILIIANLFKIMERISEVNSQKRKRKRVKKAPSQVPPQ